MREIRFPFQVRAGRQRPQGAAQQQPAPEPQRDPLAIMVEQIQGLDRAAEQAAARIAEASQRLRDGSLSAGSATRTDLLAGLGSSLVDRAAEIREDCRKLSELMERSARLIGERETPPAETPAPPAENLAPPVKNLTRPAEDPAPAAEDAPPPLKYLGRPAEDAAPPVEDAPPSVEAPMSVPPPVAPRIVDLPEAETAEADLPVADVPAIDVPPIPMPAFDEPPDDPFDAIEPEPEPEKFADEPSGPMDELADRRREIPDRRLPTGVSEGVRLIATQMAIAGSSRAEIERRLRSQFGVRDADLALDDIFGSRESEVR